MNRPIAFTLIVSKELTEAFCDRACRTLSEEGKMEIRSVHKETYWKNSEMIRAVYEFVPTEMLAKARWQELFDEVISHNSISCDSDSLEIAYYSAVGDSSDPFAVLYIPSEWIKEKNE